MKYSQSIGVVAVLALIGVCFIPWAYVASVNITITGLHAGDFGKPGLMAIIFGCVNAILFATPKIWAKRTNVFIAAIVLSWSIRNFIVITACPGGDCPQKEAGIYLQALLSFIILIMALLPKIELPKEES